jgi:hypothetical protein
MRARRLPIVDEYAEDGRVAVFTEQGMVVVLSELATVAWSVLGDMWTGADDLADALVAEFGRPTDDTALALTEQTLRRLAQHALVELDDA